MSHLKPDNRRLKFSTVDRRRQGSPREADFEGDSVHPDLAWTCEDGRANGGSDTPTQESSVNKPGLDDLDQRPWSILVVDDKPEDRELLRYLLRGAANVELEVLEAGSAAEARRVCQERTPDCIVLDNRLPDEAGISLLRDFTAEPYPPRFPVVMLTGSGDHETAVQAMKAGAQDYLVKGRVTGDSLFRSIRNAVEKVRLRRKIEEQRRELLRVVSTDDLTGLNNRRYLLDRLEEESRRSLRYGIPLSLLLMDVDHFKQVNDRFGHPKGDEVLARIAQVIRSCLRKSDIAGRYGGEEFGVLLTNTNGVGAGRMASRLLLNVSREVFRTASGEEFQVTCSIGAAEFHRSVQDWSQLLSKADQALYQAKNCGRNQVAFYSTEADAARAGQADQPGR